MPTPPASTKTSLGQRLNAHARDRWPALDRVQVHFAVHDAGGLRRVDPAALEAEVRRLARTWGDQLTDELVTRHGDERRRIREQSGHKRTGTAAGVIGGVGVDVTTTIIGDARSEIAVKPRKSESQIAACNQSVWPRRR